MLIAWVDILELLLPWTLAPALVIANLAFAHRWARWASWIVSGILALIPLVLAGLSAGREGLTLRPLIYLFAALAMGICLVPRLRRQLARVIPIQVWNPVQVLALQLAILLLGDSAIANFATAHPLSAGNFKSINLLSNFLGLDLPMVVLSLFAVGVPVRRGIPQAMRRLGLAVPRLRQVVLALVVAQAFIGLGVIDTLISRWLTPDLTKQVDEVGKQLYQSHANDVLFSLLLALIAGVCEEFLFRGALQPRFGILLTSVLFTAVHLQYGLTLASLLIFVLSLTLGLMRKYTNLTSCIICHAIYDGLVGLLPLLPAVVFGIFLFLLLPAQIIGLGLFWLLMRLLDRPRQLPVYDSPMYRTNWQ